MAAGTHVGSGIGVRTGSLHPLAKRYREAKLTNEAGMLLILSRFYFWNTVKAGMLMKTLWLALESRNVIDK